MRTDKFYELQLEKQELKRKARKSILAFTEFTMPNYRPNWHHELLCEYLDRFIAGDIRNLMVFMPPRHGKSELVSRRLPAYLLGVRPATAIIASSYSADLAGMMNRDVQRIMDSDEYAELFPDSLLPVGRGGSRVRNTEVFETEVGGFYKSAGVGGGITGMGANCFPSGVGIDTGSGYKDISQIEVGDFVWSFNHEKGFTELRRVEAVSSRIVSRLVRVATASGRELLCTPEHPFFTEEYGYRKAKDIAGRRVIVRRLVSATKSYGCITEVHPVWSGIHSFTLRLREVFKKRTQRTVLHQSVQQEASRSEESTEMCDLRKSGRKKNAQVLRDQLPPTSIKEFSVKPIQDSVSGYKSFNKIPRFIRMLYLQIKNQVNGSSHRREQAQRPAGEFDNRVPPLPYEDSSLQSDYVSSVERISGGQIRVYDIQVEGNHNFFAKQILVHNCAIIDDPIKNQEEANSQTVRDSIWGWYTSTLYTRLQNPRSVLLTLTRWHEDDLAGRLLELARNNPDADQWTVLKLPARCEQTDKHPDDPRETGESLWESDFGDKVLTSIQSSVGPSVWTSLYQQDPRPPKGALFKAEMFEYCDLPGKYDYTFITADTAYTEKEENDFTVFSAWGVAFINREAQMYLINVWRERIEADVIEIPAETFIRKYVKWGFKGAYIEPKGHGIYLNKKFRLKNIMMPKQEEIDEFFKDRRLEKKERAAIAAPHLTNRKIYISKDIPQKEELVKEALSFPKGSHDDFVDTLIDAIKKVYCGPELGILAVIAAAQKGAR